MVRALVLIMAREILVFAAATATGTTDVDVDEELSLGAASLFDSVVSAEVVAVGVAVSLGLYFLLSAADASEPLSRLLKNWNQNIANN